METQIPTSSNDRSRTYWTQTMERYFIDLMLERMSRGNRVGHTFNKQAWTDMLVVFNAKFGSQYDKEVLKSRYTNLWKQFNDVKDLLGHTGFSWDESRQMVVADDHVWNAYIKVHPDARSYKTKAVLNFNDLCVIYGYTTADGRYSRSSHDIDFDDEVQGVNLGDGMGNPDPANNERPRTEWTVAMDQYFIELMLDQIGRGDMPNNSFNKQAWTDMLTFFNAKFGAQHDKRVLRHRWKKLSKYYSDLTFLLKQDVFSWDETQQMIVADDNVWDTNTKAHPHMRAYKMKTLPNYNDLALVYGDATENSVQSNFPQQKDDGFTGKTAEDETQNQPLGSCERVRTYWTPPMDRILIDLLLDHVHKGNKFGKTFVTQAWNEMAASFNSTFQSNHGKDIFKNRYKHLRRLYNDIKNLLENSGFSWDEAREMVTAEDYVWDAYIKVHPNARLFRVKTVPSYQKLCVIFGPETSDGRYSRLAQTIDPNDETPVLMTDESSVDPSRVDWQPELDCYFIDLMLEQVQCGNKIDNTFNEEAWHHMTRSINEKFGILSTRCILEYRYNSLMKECDNISHLLGQGGFTWDVNQQMLLANDPVWEALTKEQPDVVVYRNKVLHNYVDLYQIQRNQVSCKGVDAPDTEGQIGNCGILEVDLDGLDGDYQFPVDDILIAAEPTTKPTAEPSGLELERPCKLQKISNKEMADAVPVERAIEALQAIPDIDDELLLDGCDLLEDERKAKTFLALDTLLRKKWLLRKLRP